MKNNVSSSKTLACRLFCQWHLFALGAFFSTEAIGQRPENMIYNASAGSFWNTTDLNWNENEAWVPFNGAEFSGIHEAITLQQDIGARYLHFKGTSLSGSPAEFTVRGNGNRLTVQQIIATSLQVPPGGDFDPPVPIVTFRDIDVTAIGAGVGTPVPSVPEYEIYDYYDQVRGQSERKPILHFRESSSLLGHLGNHPQLGAANASYDHLGAEVHFHDTSVFDSVGVANGSQHFYNTSSMVMARNILYAVTGGERFFHHESVLDIRYPGTDFGFYNFGIMRGSQTFYDSSVMNAATTHSVRYTSEYNDESRDPQPQFTFYDNSQLNVTAIGAIEGGEFYFHESSIMEIQDGWVSSGAFRFNQTSSLNILEGGQVTGVAAMLFYDQSELNIFAEDALVRDFGIVSQNRHIFYEESVLNAEVGHAVGDVKIDFRGDSIFNVNARFAVVAPTENPNGLLRFYDNSILNATALQSVTGGKQIFYDHSTLNAHAMFALEESTQEFHGDSVMNALATASVNAGIQTFYENSKLNVLAASAIAGIQLTFYGTSSLEAEVTNALQQNNLIKFRDSSTLNVNAVNGLTNGIMDFRGTSVLNANADGAIGGGSQVFSNTTTLNAIAFESITGGFQAFYDSSSLNANAGSSITGGVQTFDDSSSLNANAGSSITGGVQTFLDESTLNTRFFGAVEGGEQNFYNSATFNTNNSQSINGGTQVFRDDSTLNLSEKSLSGGTQSFYHNSIANATASGSIFGGTQRFYDDSRLLATEEDAIDGGSQIFDGASTLSALHADAISGGTQLFRDSSTLNAAGNALRSANEINFLGNSTLNALVVASVSGGSQVFNDSSTLNIMSEIGLTGGTQRFLKTSVLNLNAANAITGGTQSFADGSTMNVNASYGLSAGLDFSFPDSTVLNANATYSITAGTLSFSGGSTLNANATYSITAGTLSFSGGSTLNANALDAIDGGVQTFTSGSTLNINTSWSVASGLHQTFLGDSTMNANVANSITGAPELSYQRVYNTLHGTIPEAGTALINASFNTNATLNLAAENAMTGGLVVALGSVTINVTEANGISGGFLYVGSGTTTLNLTASHAITGGSIVAGTTYASAANAISGGLQFFGPWGELNATTSNAVSGGLQEFWGGSELNASASLAINGGEQRFESGSGLNASHRNAVRGGIQRFNDAAFLNILVSDAVIGGVQNFEDSSRLNAGAEWGIIGGQQNFYNTAALYATEFSAVRGGTQRFYGSSVFRANADRTLLNGTQHFYENSRMEVLNSSTRAIGGGTQNFHDDSVLYSAWRETITAGTQNFYDDSRLIAQGGFAINGGIQNFYNSSRLEAIGVPASNAVRSGVQNFYDTSSLVAARASAVTGGVQTFYIKSTLYASEAGSVNGVEVRLHHGARLEIGAVNALSTNTRVSFQNPEGNLPGGIFALNGFHTSVGELRSATLGSGRIENDAEQAATLTVSFTTPAVLFSGNIRDGEDSAALSIIKANTGAWTLSGENSWTGGTSIQGGRIVAAHDSALGTGSVFVQANATLAAAGKRSISNDLINQGLVAGDVNGEVLTLSGDLSGAGALSGNIELAGTFDPGNSPAVIQATGNLTFTDLHALRMEIGGLQLGTGYDAFNVTGTLQLGGHLQVALIDSYSPHNAATFALFTAGQRQGTFTSYDFSKALLVNSKLAWDISQLAVSGQLSIVGNPFYTVEDPEGTLNIFRTGDGTWIANAPSDYAGEVLIEGATVQISHAEALGSGEVTVGEDGMLESEGSLVLSNDIVNQGTIVGPDADGEEKIRMEGDVSGDGSYEGNIEFAGSFSPGNSPALIGADGNLTLDEMNTLTMEIGGLGRGTQYDAFDVTGTLSLGGHLVVTLTNGFAPGANDTFQFFNAGNRSDMFATFDFSGAALGNDLAWDTSSLGTTGQLGITVIPEPSTWMLLIGVAAFFMIFSRRNKNT